MNKTEFYKAVANETGMTQKDMKTVFETAQDVMFRAVKNGDEVKMFDGVTFVKVHKDARTGRNPQTGATIQIAAKDSPKVKIGKAFKDAVC